MEHTNTTIAVKAKRNYKDTLFRMLFRDEKQLLQLYNAVNRTHYTNAEDLQIVTLENAIYMNMKNDLAFVMDFYLNLYASTLIRIPTPRFVIFYNGVEEQRERKVLKLSDAYEQKMKEPELELKVLMLNINDGNNKELLDQCKLLKEYMLYVDCVRAYVKQMKLDEAVELAVDECIKNGILQEFLRKNRSEAIAVSIFEYDEEREKEKLRKAEYEAGEKQGIEQGIRILIHTCKEFNLSKEETLVRVQKEFSVSENDAKGHLLKYWDR